MTAVPAKGSPGWSAGCLRADPPRCVGPVKLSAHTLTKRVGHKAMGHTARRAHRPGAKQHPSPGSTRRQAAPGADQLVRWALALSIRSSARSCAAPPYCKMYFKTAAAGTSPSGSGWTTLFKYPPPPSAQGDPSCYSTHMFTSEAVAVISNHAAANARIRHVGMPSSATSSVRDDVRSPLNG